ncbi:MAG: hypothetical protein WBF99_16405 [Xanthobacteraceae bacterium]
MRFARNSFDQKGRTGQLVRLLSAPAAGSTQARDTSAAQAKENSFILISPPRVISHSHSKQQWNILIDPSGVAPSVREKIRAPFNLPPFDIR